MVSWQALAVVRFVPHSWLP